MTSRLDKLEELLSDDYPVQKAADDMCTLKEKKTQKGQSKHVVKLTGCKDDIKVVKLPDGQPNVLKKGIKRICDYLIFIPNESENSVLIVFCEMTTAHITLQSKECSGEARNKAEQIQHTIPLLDYILSGFKVHFGKEFKFKRRYVILCKPIEKQLTRFDPNQVVKESCKFKGLPISVIRAHSQISINYLLR